jgi:hypothetical protein
MDLPPWSVAGPQRVATFGNAPVSAGPLATGGAHDIGIAAKN